MAFLKCRRGLLRFGFIFLLILPGAFLSACTGNGNNPGAGAEGDGEPHADIEEGTQENQWNKMTWDKGKWG